MRKKQFKKRVGMLVISAMLVFLLGMVANASYVTVTSMDMQLVGTSGSQWRTKAEGKSSNLNGWLQAAIRRSASEGWKWGNADSGNKQVLTAYSPGVVGAPSNMEMKTDHN